MVSYEEFRHSAASLTVSVGRNDYNGYKLFCNGFFHEWHYLSHPRASVARPGDLLDCRIKPDNDNYLFVIPRFSSFPRHIRAFLPPVIPVLDTGIQKNTRHGLTICTQKAARFSKGSCRSRCCGQAGYSLLASAKVLAAAGVAVKLATACALQQRFVPQPASAQWRSLVKLATACKPAWQTKYSPPKNI